MNEEADGMGTEALAVAEETIARQAAEIDRLRSRLASERFIEEVREALSLASTAGIIGSPVTHARLLEMIVETAAHVISARAAALFLMSEEKEELVFEVALGSMAEEVKKFRVPLGHGIAGLVAASGQPMAISDAESDPRLAADISEAIGYVPHSVLCVPLFYGNEVIGALELLDKEGAPSFSADDIEALGLFANQAAVALQQSRTHQNLAALIGEVLQSLGGRQEENQQLHQRARVFAGLIEEDSAYDQALELAQLVHEIVYQGENEFKACRSILLSFTDYLRLRSATAADLVRGIQ